MEKFENKKR